MLRTRTSGTRTAMCDCLVSCIMTSCRWRLTSGRTLLAKMGTHTHTHTHNTHTTPIVLVRAVTIGQVWCNVGTKAQYENQRATDVHAPGARFTTPHTCQPPAILFVFS